MGEGDQLCCKIHLNPLGFFCFVTDDQMKKMRQGSMDLKAANYFHKQYENKETCKINTR